MVAAVLLCSACVPVPTPTPTAAATATPTAQPTPAPSPTLAPQAGGTIYVLKQEQQFDQVDPQRIYDGEDLAFFGATLYRSLESFTYSADPILGTTLTPDLATDLGTPTDGGRIWSFTLRDGVTFQTGAPITCEDVKYGVSRTFATDVINQGPTYAVAYLAIPTSKDGSSSYLGPYKKTGQALFDKAVECSPDHRTITFHLNRPVADFNDTVTLGFSPVPRAADTGETYGTTPDSLPVSSGPYLVKSYTTGNGGKLVLVRNPMWDPASDPIRKAYPDSWEVDLGIVPSVADQRIVASAGPDAFALEDASLQPSDVRSVFADPTTPTAPFASRATAGFDPYVRYDWINVQRVPNVKIRQAMMVALDRAAIRDIYGGEFYGSFADGVIKPNIGQDYARTGIWDTLFGQAIPDTGDPVLARKLIAESGEKAPPLAFNTPVNPTAQQAVAVVISSLGKAGFSVTLKPPSCPPGYYCTIFGNDPYNGDFGTAGWGADWPNASTVIPPLFTMAGGWDLSMVNDPASIGAIEDAGVTLDRAQQAQKWQALNREAVDNAWVIPTFFSREERVAGTKVGPVYLWPAYDSWPYGEMYVTP